MNKFGSTIREKREGKEMLLRHVSAQLDIDTALLSKIERGEKKAKREHLKTFSKLFELDLSTLEAYWLADQVYELIKGEKQAETALELVKDKLSN